MSGNIIGQAGDRHQMFHRWSMSRVMNKAQLRAFHGIFQAHYLNRDLVPAPPRGHIRLARRARSPDPAQPSHRTATLPLSYLDARIDRAQRLADLVFVPGLWLMTAPLVCAFAQESSTRRLASRHPPARPDTLIFCPSSHATSRCSSFCDSEHFNCALFTKLRNGNEDDEQPQAR